METLLNLNWVTLIPLVILLTGLLKDFSVFKNIPDQIVNIIVGLVLIGLVFLGQALNFNWAEIGPFEAIAVLIVNPAIYDKYVKPTLDFLKGKK